MKWLVAFFVFCFMAAMPAAATTYYIDYAGGSNSNAGISQGAAWKSAPGMQTGGGCAGSTHFYAPAAGDKFIFKGGVSWPSACFTMSISTGGTASTPDYYGVDKTWFNGGSWTRPKFAADSLKLASGFNVIRSSCAAFSDFQAPTAACNWNTFDNIEIGPWDVTPNTGSNNFMGSAFTFGGAISPDAATGVVLENMYIHDWFSTTNIVGSVGCNNQQIGPPPDCSALFAYGVIYGVSLVTNTTISDAAGHYVFNGVTINDYIMGGVAGSGEVANSVIHDGLIGCSSDTSCHDSEFYHIQGGTTLGYHSHVLYEDALGFQTMKYLYNNYVHDNNPGIVVNAFYQTFIFNNVFSNNSQSTIAIACSMVSSVTCAAAGDSPSAVGWVANNTIDDSMNPGTAANPCYRWGSGGSTTTGAGTLNFYNNICIPGSSGVGGFSVATINGTSPQTNYTMGTSEATNFGFTATNKYSPSGSDSNISAQGSNRSGNCIGILANLCLDTSGAPWFGGSYKPRPTAPTGWDRGAYQGQGGAFGPPVVTITSPTCGSNCIGTLTLAVTAVPQGSTTINNCQFTIDGSAFGSAISSPPYTTTWDTTKSSNLGHTIGASCTDSASHTGSAVAVNVTVNNSSPGCFTTDPRGATDSTKILSLGFTSQTGTFTAIWNETPWSSANDTVVGLSSVTATSYGSMSALLLADVSGVWLAYNGTGYAAVNSAPYVSGATYAFTITVNFGTSTYSLSETSPSNIVIASGYAFRAAAMNLAFFNGISSGATFDTAKVCNFTITGSSSISANPGDLAFGNVTQGGTSNTTENLSVVNGPANISSVAVSGADFSLFSNGGCIGSITTSCAPVVQYAPSTTGLETGTLTITSDATGSPQVFNLTGTGIVASPPSLLFCGSAPCSSSITTLLFGNINPGASSQQGPINVTVTSGPANFSSVVLSGADKNDFQIVTNTCGTNVPTACQVIVQYNPRRVGPEIASLDFTSNATGSPYSISLLGVGQRPSTPTPTFF